MGKPAERIESGKALIPAGKDALTVFTDPAHTMEIRWPKTFAMALFDFKATKKGSTWTTYEVALRDFFSFLGAVGVDSPDALTTTHITSYIDYLRKEGKADRTIRLYISAASSYYEFLTRPKDTKGDSIIRSNPFRSVRDALPTIQPYVKKDTRRELSLEEYTRILKTCDPNTVAGRRDSAIVALTFWTARRRLEVSRLLRDDIGNDRGTPFVRFLVKGGEYKRIDLTAGIMAEISEYWRLSGRTVGPRSPVFVATTDAGKYLVKARNLRVRQGENPLSPSALDQMLKSRAKQAGIDPEEVQVHVHGLRHLAARVLREMGKDLKEIKERLGHKRIGTTDIYLGSMERVRADGLNDFERVALGKAEGKEMRTAQGGHGKGGTRAGGPGGGAGPGRP